MKQTLRPWPARPKKLAAAPLAAPPLPCPPRFCPASPSPPPATSASKSPGSNDATSAAPAPSADCTSANSSSAGGAPTSARGSAAIASASDSIKLSGCCGSSLATNVTSSGAASVVSPTAAASPNVIATRTGSASTDTYIMARPNNAIRCTMPLTSPGPTTRDRRRWARRLFDKRRGTTAGREREPCRFFASEAVFTSPAVFPVSERRPEVRVVRSRGFVGAVLGVGGDGAWLLPACRSVVSLASSPACSPIRWPRSASSRNTAATRTSFRSIAAPQIPCSVREIPPVRRRGVCRTFGRPPRWVTIRACIIMSSDRWRQHIVD